MSTFGRCITFTLQVIWMDFTTANGWAVWKQTETIWFFVWGVQINMVTILQCIELNVKATLKPNYQCNATKSMATAFPTRDWVQDLVLCSSLKWTKRHSSDRALTWPSTLCVHTPVSLVSRVAWGSVYGILSVLPGLGWNTEGHLSASILKMFLSFNAKLLNRMHSGKQSLRGASQTCVPPNLPGLLFPHPVKK